MTETLQRVFYDGDQTLRSTGDENSEFFGFVQASLRKIQAVGDKNSALRYNLGAFIGIAKN
jgi:hypothetical protein